MRASRGSLPLIPLLAIIAHAACGCGDDPTRVTQSQTSPAPEPFVTTIGSTDHDEVHDVAVDPSGNVFVTGGFNATVEFAGDTFDPADGPVFVAKFDPTGECLWIKHIWGAIPDGPLRLGADHSGDVILQGAFTPQLTIDGVTVTNYGGGEHLFMARLTGAGSLKWISYDSGMYLSVGFAMRVGGTGGSAVTGFIQTGATFGNTELAVPGFDFFLVRYDSQGKALWAAQTGADTRATGKAVSVDVRGNTVVAGNFLESFTLDGVEITADAGDSFVARYNAAGELQWLKSLGDNTAEVIYDIATDRDGDIYIAGRRDTNTLWKLDSGGNVVWKTGGGPAQDMAVDNDKNILLSGSFSGTLSVGGMDVISNGFQDFFVARYDASGQGLSVVSGGSSRDDRAQGLALDGDGAAVTVVDFYGSFEFGGESVTSRGEQDILITRIARDDA